MHVYVAGIQSIEIYGQLITKEIPKLYIAPSV